MVTSGSAIMRTIWLTVVVVWAAGSSVSASIPIAVVRVPPCLGPPPVDGVPPPQAATTRAARPSTAMTRVCTTFTSISRSPVRVLGRKSTRRRRDFPTSEPSSGPAASGPAGHQPVVHHLRPGLHLQVVDPHLFQREQLARKLVRLA